MRAPVPEPDLLGWLFEASAVAFGWRQEPVPAFPRSAVATVAGANGALFLPWLGRLERRFPGTIPPEIAERGRAASLVVAARNMALLDEFRPVAESFEERGVRWAALKGLDYLARLFPGPEWRAMADVDVHVHPHDVDLALAILSEHGFAQVSPVEVPRLAPAIAVSKGRAYVDVHRRLLRGGGDRIPPGAFLDASRLVVIESTPVRLARVGDALASSALLLGKDLFLAHTTNPCRAVELALLAELAGDETIADLRARLRQWGARRLFDRTLALADWTRGRAGRPGWLDEGFGDPARFVGPEINRWRYMFGCAAMQDGPIRASRFLAANLAGKLTRRSGRAEPAARA
jgi:hypothetical protein